ncbi:MAG: hypothetical protein SPF60_05135, partial [Lachnospiraceae bacterium]|nr:hypothetical protein [Lachnospiraceae bacterium]
ILLTGQKFRKTEQRFFISAAHVTCALPEAEPRLSWEFTEIRKIPTVAHAKITCIGPDCVRNAKGR